MSATRGVIVGMLGLTLLQALLSTEAATRNTSGALTAVAGGLSRWLDPTVPLIPDRRATSSPELAAYPTGGGSSGGGYASGATKVADRGNASQVDAWINQAFSILLANGYRPDQLDADGVRAIIQYESGGNPNAINNYDINARNGHPSQGLMQTIPSTFYGNALPGYNINILDPVSNIIAGVRYGISRYGSIGNIPGVKSLHAGGPYKPY